MRKIDRRRRRRRPVERRRGERLGMTAVGRNQSTKPTSPADPSGTTTGTLTKSTGGGESRRAPGLGASTGWSRGSSGSVRGGSKASSSGLSRWGDRDGPRPHWSCWPKRMWVVCVATAASPKNMAVMINTSPNSRTFAAVILRLGLLASGGLPRWHRRACGPAAGRAEQWPGHA